MAKIYKDTEFKAFIEEIEKGSIPHWQDIAKAIGVSKDTITVWKKHPEAQAAISRGITEAIEGMTSAGKRDWRMWESKLKMLGVVPTERTELGGLDGEKFELVIRDERSQPPAETT